MDEFKAADVAAMDKVALITKEREASTLHLNNRKGILKTRPRPSIAATYKM